MTRLSTLVFNSLMHAGTLMRALRKFYFRSNYGTLSILVAPASDPSISPTSPATATTPVVIHLPQSKSSFTISTVTTSPGRTTSYVPRCSNPTFMLGVRQVIRNIWTMLPVPSRVSKSTCQLRLRMRESMTSTT